MEYNLNDLKKKWVINLKDGKKLGKICDVKISVPSFKICAFILSSSIGIFGGEQIEITPCEITKIGEDAILVRPKGMLNERIDDCEE